MSLFSEATSEATSTNTSSPVLRRKFEGKGGVLKLSEIFQSHLEELHPSERGYASKYGFILILSLSKSEVKSSSRGADTLGVLNGYLTKPKSTDTKIYTPFMSTWRGFTINPDGKLREIETLDTQFPEGSKEKELYKDVPINWRLNFDLGRLRDLLNDEGGTEASVWREFKNLLLKEQKLQLQCLVVKGADPIKGVGSLAPTPYKNGEGPTQAYNIFLSKADLLTCRLVAPGQDFIGRVDKPSAVMERLIGRITSADDESEVIQTVNAFKALEAKTEATNAANTAAEEALKATIPTAVTNSTTETANDEENSYGGM